MKRSKLKNKIKAPIRKESVVIEIDIRPATAKLKELQRQADRLSKTLTKFVPK